MAQHALSKCFRPFQKLHSKPEATAGTFRSNILCLPSNEQTKASLSIACRSNVAQAQTTDSFVSETSSSPSSVEAEGDELVQTEDLVELGTFTSPHGLRGELKFQSISDATEERLAQETNRWAWMKGRRKPHYKAVTVQGFRSSVSKGNLVWLVKLAGVDSVEEAEAFRGLTLGMLADDRPDLDSQDEFYVQELIGMQVVLHADKSIVGTVTDVYDGTGEHDLLKISHASGLCLIPFVREIVPVVNHATRRMEISPPEGLLDLKAWMKANSSTPKNKKRQKRRYRPKSEVGAGPSQ